MLIGMFPTSRQMTLGKLPAVKHALILEKTVFSSTGSYSDRDISCADGLPSPIHLSCSLGRLGNSNQFTTFRAFNLSRNMRAQLVTQDTPLAFTRRCNQ